MLFRSMAGMLPFQGGSLSDILTALKNVVTAISNIGVYSQSIYNNVPTKQLFSGAATTSVSTLFSASSSVNAHINTINICNTSSSAATFSIYIVPSGGAASASNAVFYNCSIAPNATVLWTGTLVMPPSSSLQASASVTAVTFMFAGNNST